MYLIMCEMRFLYRVFMIFKKKYVILLSLNNNDFKTFIDYLTAVPFYC